MAPCCMLRRAENHYARKFRHGQVQLRVELGVTAQALREGGELLVDLKRNFKVLFEQPSAASMAKLDALIVAIEDQLDYLDILQSNLVQLQVQLNDYELSLEKLKSSTHVCG